MISRRLDTPRHSAVQILQMLLSGNIHVQVGHEEYQEKMHLQLKGKRRSSLISFGGANVLESDKHCSKEIPLLVATPLKAFWDKWGIVYVGARAAASVLQTAGKV